MGKKVFDWENLAQSSDLSSEQNGQFALAESAHIVD